MRFGQGGFGRLQSKEVTNPRELDQATEQPVRPVLREAAASSQVVGGAA